VLGAVGGKRRNLPRGGAEGAGYGAGRELIRRCPTLHP